MDIKSAWRRLRWFAKDVERAARRAAVGDEHFPFEKAQHELCFMYLNGVLLCEMRRFRYHVSGDETCRISGVMLWAQHSDECKQVLRLATSGERAKIKLVLAASGDRLETLGEFTSATFCSDYKKETELSFEFLGKKRQFA